MQNTGFTKYVKKTKVEPLSMLKHGIQYFDSSKQKDRVKQLKCA